MVALRRDTREGATSVTVLYRPVGHNERYEVCCCLPGVETGIN